MIICFTNECSKKDLKSFWLKKSKNSIFGSFYHPVLMEVNAQFHLENGCTKVKGKLKLWFLT